MAGKGAPVDNIYATKFKTKKARAKLFKDYLEHCELGYPDNMFEPCDIKTFKDYATKFPLEFPSDLIHAAQMKRAKLVYDIGMRGTVGMPLSYKDPRTGQTVTAKRGFNAKSWQFIMMNLLGWRTRDDLTSKDKQITGKRTIYVPQKLPNNYDELMQQPGTKNATNNARGTKPQATKPA